ncbi:MAG: alpha/beta fold hydrolase [Solirubrobacterales bacterium]
MRRAELEPQERFARVGELELCYEDLGDPAGEPLVLVMGLGAQLIHWNPEFVNLLVDRGFRVIRFDNRDAGHSTKLGGRPPGTVSMLLGLPRGRAYHLDEMADDVPGLMDSLGIDVAHVVGVSMGGMISQAVAYRHPDRVRSLTMLMSGSGKRVTSLPRMRALGTLLTKPARDKRSFVSSTRRMFEVIGSPAYPMDAEREAQFVRVLELTWERAHHPAGVARQLHAITSSGDRTKRLAGVRAPTLVIHGDSDPLVRPAAGRALARAIPGAEFRLVPGMGHDMPAELLGELADAVAATARRGGMREAPAKAPAPV